MAQRGQLTWSELRVGLFVLVGIVVVMLGIFYVTGTGFLGAKYRLVAYLPEVDGLTLGAPVSLDGVEVGNVDIPVAIAAHKPGEPAGREPQRGSGDSAHETRFPGLRTQRLDGQPDYAGLSGRPHGDRAARLHRRRPAGRTGGAGRRGEGHQGDRRARRRPDAKSERPLHAGRRHRFAYSARAGNHRQIADRSIALRSFELHPGARGSSDGRDTARAGNHREAG